MMTMCRDVRIIVLMVRCMLRRMRMVMSMMACRSDFEYVEKKRGQNVQMVGWWG